MPAFQPDASAGNGKAAARIFAEASKSPIVIERYFCRGPHLVAGHVHWPNGRAMARHVVMGES